MTDNEIIKALERCSCGYCYCGEGCPLANDDRYDDDISKCTSKLSENALDLINRQRAEISVKKKLLDKAEIEIERLEHIRAEMSREIEDSKDSNEHLAVFLEEARAELEDLREIVFMDRTEAIKALKSEAIRDFAERLKKETLFDSGWGVIQPDVIDNLVKEMTEGTE